MARFKYIGEVPQSWVVSYGPCTEIRIPKKDGTWVTHVPEAPATEFVIGEDIGLNITDPRSLRAMRADARFEELP